MSNNGSGKAETATSPATSVGRHLPKLSHIISQSIHFILALLVSEIGFGVVSERALSHVISDLA